MVITRTRCIAPIGMYIQKYNIMHYYKCHMDTGEDFWSVTKHILFVIRRTMLLPGVCPCISIRAMMQHVDIGEVVVTRIIEC